MMNPVIRKRWTERRSKSEPGNVAALVSALGIGEITASILCRRGIVEEQAAKDYVESLLASLPDPFLLPGMDKGVNRLARALERGESIVIHGDYDVDGITGTALLVQGLRDLGGDVDYHIPLRLKDGYGLSGQALSAAAQKGASLVVSVDCGVSAVQEAALALELELDLIITDQTVEHYQYGNKYCLFWQ
ncbi:DHH family phosphoesterase [Desulfuromonas sp. AOP6]|uniref:DHH family phosphoesterase n=1 Tax=Desulfuromonas sp. AOP6 TaxID=1566351 RepID=UPI001CEDA65A|nr:DHH family phosphoesterase [Desulfuromonas sp. AOP6]